MSSALRPLKACTKGAIEIGKLNIILIVLIVAILVVLISKEIEPNKADDQTTLVQAQAVAEADHTVADDTFKTAEVNQPELQKPQPETSPKKQKRNRVAEPAVGHQSSQEARLVESPSAGSEALAENHISVAEPESASQKELSRSIIVFNLWSVSELRLRSAYTRLMNDSSIAAAQTQLLKKDYLSFVNKRTHKCGELDDKFASNINTIEKLTFTDKNVKTLECHTSENISEMSRLNELGMHES